MKKLTLKATKDIMQRCAITDITHSFGENELVLHPYLTPNEEFVFVRRVVDNAFLENEFRPELFELTYRATLLQMMSNIPVPKMKGDDENIDIDAMHQWIHSLPVSFWADVDAHHYVSHLRSVCLKKLDEQLADNRSSLKMLVELLEIIQPMIDGLREDVRSGDIDLSNILSLPQK